MPGTRNMLYGLGWAVLGLVVTGVTYAVAPGGHYIVAVGAIVVGGIQFLVGLFQFALYKLKTPAGREKAHAKAAITTIVQAMLATVVADGSIEDSELEAVAVIYQQLFGHTIAKSEVREAAEKMRKKNFDLAHALGDKHSLIDSEMKCLTLKAAFLVAGADGAIGSKESVVLQEIAGSLRMSRSEVESVMADLRAS
jgi:uncharacterized tellurite resistance protein B-like protein